MWRRILALMIKEFLALFKDKRSRVVIIVPPLIQLMVFGYAATFDLKQFHCGLQRRSRHGLAGYDRSVSRLAHFRGSGAAGSG